MSKNTDNKLTLTSIVEGFREGIITKNPVLVQLLGLCSTLAVTTSVINGLGMGLSMTVVLIFSNLLISLLRKFIPSQIRIAAFIVIISGFVTVIELVVKAYLPSLDSSLGLFIPLIVVNCIILARAEAFASKNKPLPSTLDGLYMGIGFTFTLVLLSTIREILGSGSFCGISLFGEDFSGILIFILPSGAFLTLAFIVAAVQYFVGKKKDKENTEK